MAGNLGFFSSYDGDLRDPLLFPQDSPVSIRVARGLPIFLSSRCWVLGPHLELRQKPQGSSPVLTWISRFLWSFHRGVRPHLMWRHASPLSTRAAKALSGFLSSLYRDQWLYLEVPKGCHTCHCVVSRYLGLQSSQCRGISCICCGLGYWGLLEWWHDHWSSSRLSS